MKLLRIVLGLAVLYGCYWSVCYASEMYWECCLRHSNHRIVESSKVVFGICYTLVAIVFVITTLRRSSSSG